MCCSDATLLRRELLEGADNPPDLFNLRGHGFTCSLAPTDRKRLLTMVARWQESDQRHAALLACGGGALSNFAPIEGWITPALTEGGAHNAGDAHEDIGWDADRARFRFVVTGRINRASSEAYSSSAQTSSRYRLQRSCCDFSDVARLVSAMRADNGAYKRLLHASGPVGATSGFVVSVAATGGGSDSLSFTNCLTCPGSAEMAAISALNEEAGGGWEQQSSFALRHMSDALPAVSCIVGPVVGQVTMTSATILFEFGHQYKFTKDTCAFGEALVEVILVDAITAVQYPCRRVVRIRAPVVFVFDTLVPGRGYEIRLSNEAGQTSTGAALGSFRTETMVAVGTAGVHTGSGIREDAAVVALRSEGGGEVTSRSYLARLVVVGENAPSMAADAFGPSIGDSARSLVAAMANASRVSAGNAAYHRVRVEEGVGLTRALEELTTPVYNGIATVIHVGGTVDLSISLETAITHILAAEAVQQNSLENSELFVESMPSPVFESESPRTLFPTNLSSTECGRQLAYAEEALRDAYRLHWGGASMRGCFAHGSHLLSSSPLVDLLRATHTNNLQQLCNELTPVCAFFI